MTQAAKAKANGLLRLLSALPASVQVIMMSATLLTLGAALSTWVALPRMVGAHIVVADSVFTAHGGRLDDLEQTMQLITRNLLLDTCLEVAQLEENPRAARHQCLATYGLPPLRN